MSSLSGRRIRRTVSGQSLKRVEDYRSTRSLEKLLEDEILQGDEIGDSEFSIEYVNVPRKLLIRDIFSSLIQFRFGFLFLIVIAVMLFFIFVFALIYKFISPACGLNVAASLNEAWLFSVLVHFKTCLGPPVDAPSATNIPSGTFWNGCPLGIMALFGQLFVGNILMSILLSSMIFNFQSISRRTQTRFSSITLSRKAEIKIEQSDCFFEIQVAETKPNMNLQCYNVIANVFCIAPFYATKTVPIDHLFHLAPFADHHPIRSLAHNVPVFIATPGLVSVRIPRGLYSDFRESPYCSVCGEEVCSHQVSPPQVGSEVTNRLRKAGVQFLVIIEGSDPVTNDRIQIQKIYRNFFVHKSEISFITQNLNDTNCEIDYTSFLS